VDQGVSLITMNHLTPCNKCAKKQRGHTPRCEFFQFEMLASIFTRSNQIPQLGFLFIKKKWVYFFRFFYIKKNIPI
jgi:hypothetical protein